MRRKIPVMLSWVLLIAMTLGLSAPTAAAQPKLVINDMDATGTIFEVTFEFDGEDWVLEGEFGFVVADFVRYGDGSFARPHTDSDMRLCAYPAGSSCDPANSDYYLAGTTPLDFESATGVIEELESGALEPISLVHANSSGTVEAVVEAEGDWEAFGAIQRLRVIDPGVQVLIGKRRDATVIGSVRFISGDGPFAALVDESLHLEDVYLAAFIDNYNEVYLGD